LRRFDVQYFAVSIDTPETNAAFARSLGITYPILSDPTKNAARAYGVLGASGFARRWTFFIARDGRILAIDRDVAAATHGSAVVEKLNALGVQQRT